VDLSLEGTNFSIRGQSITDPVVINTTLGNGTLFADSSVFMMPAQALQIYSTGRIDGERMGLLAMSATAGFGIINQRTRQLVFAQSFGLSSGTIDVQFAATIENLMPTVSLTDQTLECNSPGGSNTTLTATVSDVDGRVARVKWFVDGVAQNETSSALNTFLALGTHTVEVGVFDNDGGFASTKATVLVEDTTPPEISADPVCIWPPNHRLYVLDASDVHVADACDPNVSVTLLSGVSNQVGDGTGDGHTAEDIFVHPDAVCVRAERDGSVLYGRTYTIAATATDAASNTSSFTFDITVPHDQSPKCLDGSMPAEENDPTCTPALPTSSSEPTVTPPKTGGCQVVDTNGVWLCLLALALLRRRRR
jgi:hypothetical protein